MEQRRLSESLWNLRWSDGLPLRLTADGVDVDYVSYEKAEIFVRENYAQIFEEDGSSPFAAGKMSLAKSRYYECAGDFFLFSKDGESLGLLVGTPVDWSTYYIRSSAVKKAHQGRALVQRFLPWVFERLKAAGIERVEAETAPSNMASVYWLTRQRFNVTGTVFTERWGALTRFTKYLCEDSEAVFLRQFCMGVQYQSKERQQRVKDERQSREDGMTAPESAPASHTRSRRAKPKEPVGRGDASQPGWAALLTKDGSRRFHVA